MLIKDVSRWWFKAQPKNLKQPVAGIPLSFETGEQGAVKVYFPYAVTINKIRTIAIKAVAGTDNATITGANATGSSAGGVLTHLASAAIGDEQSATPTTNNTVAAGSYYQLTPAKTTAGGKVIASLEITTN